MLRNTRFEPGLAQRIWHHPNHSTKRPSNFMKFQGLKFHIRIPIKVYSTYVQHLQLTKGGEHGRGERGEAT